MKPDYAEYINLLHNRIHQLELEVQSLRKLLKLQDRECEIVVRDLPFLPVITAWHAKVLYSYFRGRKDVFSKRNVNKEGKGVYYPVCENFWVAGKCPRRVGEKVRCMDCRHRKWVPLSQRVLMRHLKGESEDGRDVVGIYPLLENGNCCFLVFDFDHHDELSTCDWRAEVEALRKVCNILGVDALVERSRSGEGAHVWIFFEEEISAVEARLFGSCLLTRGAELVNQKSFLSYDRMLPAQDTLPPGGLGNLIALPLQGRALLQENSAFVDEEWRAYPDQWGQLQKTRRLSSDYVSAKIKEWSIGGKEGILSCLSSDEIERPWKNDGFTIRREDIDGMLHIVESSMLYIRVDNLKPRLCNTLRRIASFSNPLYYRNRAMGLSVRGVSRIIPCYLENEPYICIPRGKKEQLLDLIHQGRIPLRYEDVRNAGTFLNVTFKAELYQEQQKAADTMLQHDIGILQAATAFGKTAVGAYLIAARKVNTLVLVHNREIMKNWLDDLSQFLKIEEPLPEYKNRSGKIRKRKNHIGCLYSAHDSIGGLIDVAMISSLGTIDDIKPLIKEYGLVIMDECHHAAAFQAEQVLREVNAKYVYGLTATPKRDDGMEQKILMAFGPIRYRFTAKQRAEMQNVRHLIYPRFTRFCILDDNLKIQEVYRKLISDEVRNALIIQDVVDCIAQKHTPLLLTKFKAHADYLYRALKGHAQHVFLLKGGRNSKERTEIRQALLNVPVNESVAVVAIGQYIGEGFNYPRLDTLLLTTPISWEGNVEQYAGRLHRDYDGKQEVIIYDYVDVCIKMLDSMYSKRLKTYRRIGYSLYMPGPLFGDESEDSGFYSAAAYEYPMENDIMAAKNEIIISSPVLNKKGVAWLLSFISGVLHRGVRVCVLTIPSQAFPERATQLELLHSHLKASGISVMCSHRYCGHFTIIDRSIVWYGNANCLSMRKDDDHMLRMCNSVVAADLMSVVAKMKNI